MRNSIKQILSLALVMLLVVSSLPVQAFAAESGKTVARNEDTGAVYESVTEALSKASSGETIVLTAEAEEMFVQVPKDVTLDLNGGTLTASYAANFGDIIDSSDDNTGFLKVDSERVMFTAENRELPVRDGEGYRFINVVQFNEALAEEENKYYFQPLFEEGALEVLKNSSEENGVSVCVYVLWQKGEDLRNQKFVFNNEIVKQYLESYNPQTGGYGMMFTLTIKNCPVSELAFVSGVVSETGVMFMSDGRFIEDEENKGLGVEVPTENNGQLSEDTAFSGNNVLAEIEAGTQLEEGATSVTLTVTPMENSESDVVPGSDETMTSYDIHIEGLSADNTVPVKVTLFRLLEKGLNSTSVALYHVENGVTVPMTLVAEPKNHNEFSYDPATGTVVICAATFSEYVTVTDNKNPWENVINTTWCVNYETATEFTISNAEELAGFGKLVDEGKSFEGKTVKLGADIDLSARPFNPIGCGYAPETGVTNSKDADGNPITGRPFKGTFDGQNYTISGLYQNGWDMGLSYCTLGGGLFASIAGGTVKNLIITGADIRMECVEMGVLVGLSQGKCTYDNIKIYDSKIANYQRATGGLIGEISPLNGSGDTTITNVTIGPDVVVGTLWGDFDAPVGGVIGALWNNNGTANVVMENVTVAAELDVYNDITSTYQWHAYRRAGMLIGNTETSAPNKNGTNVATAPLTCTDVTVKYGNWVNYHYCEFTNHNSSWPWVRVEAGENCEAYSNPRYGVPNDFNGNKVVNATHAHAEGDTCMELIPFNQLYGGGQGVYGGGQGENYQSEHEGVTIQDYYYAITYTNNNENLHTVKVRDAGDFSTENAEAEAAVKEQLGDEYTFEYWVNAGSNRIDTIPSGNLNDIVLSPSFSSNHYTVTYVDINGNIWHQETVKIGNKPNGPDKFPEYGDYKGVWSVTDFSNVKADITVYPVYNPESGALKFVPIDEDGNGSIDSYHVNGFDESSKNVVIPESFNGKPVTGIVGGAFENFSDLTNIIIPASVTYIGADAFADKEWDVVKYHFETIQILYEGTYAQWQAIEKDPEWDRWLGQTSKVYFPTNGDYVTYIEETAENSGWFEGEVDREWSGIKDCDPYKVEGYNK